jgi:hypothetical protein
MLKLYCPGNWLPLFQSFGMHRCVTASLRGAGDLCDLEAAIVAKTI